MWQALKLIEAHLKAGWDEGITTWHALERFFKRQYRQGLGWQPPTLVVITAMPKRF